MYNNRIGVVYVNEIFGVQREEELTMIEQQINPALDNNAHVSNRVHDDVITYDIMRRWHYLTDWRW